MSSVSFGQQRVDSAYDTGHCKRRQLIRNAATAGPVRVHGAHSDCQYEAHKPAKASDLVTYTRYLSFAATLARWIA